jgi:hypothetical protein
MRIEKVTDSIFCGGAILGNGGMNSVRDKGVTHIIDLDCRCDWRWVDELDHEHHKDPSDIEVLHYHFPDAGQPVPERYFGIFLSFARSVSVELTKKGACLCIVRPVTTGGRQLYA